MKTSECEASDPIGRAAALLDQAASAIVAAARLVREARCPPPSETPMRVIEPPADAVTVEPPGGWITCGQAARIANVNSGTITNAVNAGRLVSNGRTGTDRRVDVRSVREWIAKRAAHPYTGRKAPPCTGRKAPRPARPGPAPTAPTRRRAATGGRAAR